MMLRRTSRWFLVLMLMAVPAYPAPAQQPQERLAIPFEGTDVFAYLLKSRGYTALPDPTAFRAHLPKDTLVVLFGNVDVLPSVIAPHNLRTIQRLGGSVLLASDHPRRLPECGLAIMDGAGDQYDGPSYQGRAECPLIKSLAATCPGSFGLTQRGLATNRPSYFTRIPVASELLCPLAEFKLKRVSVPYAYFVDAFTKNDGRALLIAGHGIFTNGMLLRSDNDDFLFATQCLDWLASSSDGTPRKYALFIVDGKIVSSFDLDLKAPPVPLPVPPIPIPTMAVVNHLLHGIQKEKILQHILEKSGTIQFAVRIGLVVLTLLVLCYGAKKLIEQRHHTERSSALLAGPYAVPPDTSPLIEQRARSQIERNALGAEARALARAWFLEECAIPIGAWDNVAAKPAPTAQLTGGWWERRHVRRQIERLAQLAGPAMPGSFSWADMVRLTKTLQSLSARMQEGRLRLAGCSPGENS